DKADAFALAEMLRTGWYSAVHVKSEASHKLKALLGARDQLVRAKRSLGNQVRGLLRPFGIKLPLRQSTKKFAEGVSPRDTLSTPLSCRGGALPLRPFFARRSLASSVQLAPMTPTTRQLPGFITRRRNRLPNRHVTSVTVAPIAAEPNRSPICDSGVP